MPSFKDHFSTHASDYAAFRPTYPGALGEYLAGIAPGTKSVWDCGCGNGQMSVLLADFFDHVDATDASAEQVKQATLCPKISYRVAPAEQSGLDNRSCDAIVAAQAAHWFDLPKFYQEVRRVAKPNAVIALITYDLCVFGDAMDSVFLDFYHHIAGPYWPPERRVVETGYRTLDFPFAEITPPSFSMRTEWDLAQFWGYINTWSAVRGLEKAGKMAELENFKQKLTQVWQDPAHKKPISWPIALRLGRLPAHY